MTNSPLNIKSAEMAWDKGGHCIKLYLKSQNDKTIAEGIINDIIPEKQYAAIIGEITHKRSMDANAYAWVLLNRLSEKLNLPAVEIYRTLIKDIGGVSEIIPVQDSAVETWIRNWNVKGSGWQCEKIGAAQYPAGYTLVQCWYGSSVYDTKQMSRLIDLIVQECKQLQIDTLTPEEIAKLKGLEQ